MTPSMNSGQAPTTTLFPIFPQIQWNDRDYATLQATLYLFDDYIIMAKQAGDGRPGPMYLVDPLDIAARMNGAIGLSSGLLPQNCLFWGQVSGVARIGIYVEPQVWPVSVEGEKLTWHVPMPGLVVIGQEQSYQIFALKDPGWPSPQTKLYNAPCPNIGSKGVCTGNAPFPVASPDTMPQAVSAFFNSGFNNHLDTHKSKAYLKGILGQWRQLDKTKAKQYPLNDLVEFMVQDKNSYRSHQLTLNEVAVLKGVEE